MKFDERYKAKQVIDSFGYRFAKGVTGGIMTLWEMAAARLSLLTFVGTGYSFTAIITAGCWILVALGLSKEQKKLSITD